MKPINQVAHDSIYSLIMPEDLEAIDRAIYAPKEAELVARQILSTPRGVYPEWADNVTVQVATETGAAKIQHQLATDYPLVDVGMTPKVLPVKDLAVAYTATTQELEKARALGIPLDAAKAAKARKEIAKKENSLVFNGDSDFNVEGLYNLTGKTSVTKVHGGWAALLDGAGYKIVEDVRKIKGAFAALEMKAKALVLHADRYEDLEKTVSTNYDVTALQRIQTQNWFPGGIFVSTNLDDDTMLVIDNDPENVRLIILKDIYRGDTFALSPRVALFPFDERLVGVQAIFPKSVAIMTGIK